MEQQNLKRNWNDELEKVNNVPQTKYVRLKSGVPYAITFMDEGGQDYPSEFNDRITTRVDFKVRVVGGEYNGEELVWSITKGGKDSVYGKLVKLFVKKNGGRSLNYVIHVKPDGEGRDKKYSIKEFDELMWSSQV